MPDPTYTLLDAELEVGRRLWRGRKDETESRVRWMMFLDTIGRDTPLAHIKTRDMEKLVETLEKTTIPRLKRSYSPATINRVLASGSKVLRWAYENEIIDRMPRIPWCKNLGFKDVYLPQDRIEEFLTASYQYRGSDVTVALQALILTGMRVGELTTLTRDQLQQGPGGYSILVRAEKNKTFKNRVIPIPEALYVDLNQLMRTGIPSYRVLYDTCVMVSQALALDPVITPHGLRHTAATLMTQQGVPSLTVAKLMGHSSLATTRRYEHHAPATNPLSRLHMNIGVIGVHTDNNPIVDHRKHWRYARKARENSGLLVCSPLRSHSATRPSICNPLKNNDPED